MPFRLLAALALAAAVAGCASPRTHATFVTKTSLAIVDADTAPAGISIAYDRVEGYIGPRLPDGTVAPVTGFITTDGGTFDRQIRQVYVTGKAAETVAEGVKRASNRGHADSPSALVGSALPPVPPPPPPPLPPNADRPVLYFGTTTSIGMKIGFDQGSLVPNSFNLGYRRKEISVIPVDEGKFPSVLATMDTSTGGSKAEGERFKAEFGLTQYFATGTAADSIAGSRIVGEMFAARVSDAVRFREAEAQQGKVALDVLFCLSRLPNSSLERVWNNAEDLGLFASGGAENTLARIRAAPGDANSKANLQRQIYTGDLGLINAASNKHTQALEAHRDAVCRLVPKT